MRIQLDADKMIRLSDNDLILCNRKSGANNYDPNLTLARRLEIVSKKLIETSKNLSKNAEVIRTKVDEAKERKSDLQDLVFIGEETNPAKKAKVTQTRRPQRLRYTMEFKSEIPQWPLYVSSSESDDENTPMAGSPDTKFKYIKANGEGGKEHFQCPEKDCGKLFCDSTQVNNHMSVHQFDLFHCLKCFKVTRSSDSFLRHMQEHSGTEIKCKVCDMRFSLKSSLINHMQKHNDDKLVCDVCKKTFKYHQSGIEHIQWFHRPTKDVPCPICKKMFQMPTYMRCHRARCHGLVTQLVYPQA